MDMVGVDKPVEEVKMKLEDVNKKLVKEYNDFLKIFCMVKNLAGDCHGCCCGRGGQQGDGGGQQEVGHGVQ